MLHSQWLYASILMKEDMFEVLMYLFENHMQSNCKLYLTDDVLMVELERAGFNSGTIDKALDWLEGLLLIQENTAQVTTTESFRVFTAYEAYKLNADVIHFLLFLQRMGILNTITRELVIDRLMAIQDQDIDLPQVKWVTLLVLFNQPDEEAALACMENLVLENTAYGLH
jgi:Smg protein